MFVLALLPVLLGVLVGWGGYLGWRERLPRDRGAGVRTAATLRGDEAFRVANKVAGLPTMAAGGIGILGGLAGLLMPDTVGLVIAVAVGLVGMLALVAGGGLLGHQAALAVPEPAPSSACGGCACSSGGCGAGAAARG
ncbi:SdpI/YhfL protein family protein [Amycolatopsis arida]|uniref:SdpI/YhfL protein family protein n=1 Tax=Amycolatopsis arida TaxID=587909 RepID=A0A1I5TQ95_9PSEU|nr:SdpI family protein [Amycolatopsis arida]TDX96011.1 SdpI/YhfL family protein [Amycolatopsis arida]SFP85193.1 SdpI/YhfL protein family protein [Amycolatopsis arida]